MNNEQEIRDDLKKVDMTADHVADILIAYDGAFVVQIINLDDEDATEAKISTALREKYGTDVLLAYWENAGASLPPNNETIAAAALLASASDVKVYADEEAFYVYGNLAKGLDALVKVGALPVDQSVLFLKYLASEKKLAERPIFAETQAPDASPTTPVPRG